MKWVSLIIITTIFRVASNKRSIFLSYRCINTLKSENTSSKITVLVFLSLFILRITYERIILPVVVCFLWKVHGHRENVKGDSRSIPYTGKKRIHLFNVKLKLR